LCGIAVGLVVLMMSLTGVLLTYERQMLASADRTHRVDAASDAVRLTIDELLEAVAIHDPEFAPSSITVFSDPGMPIAIGAGRASSVYVDPYSGEVLRDSAPRLRAFFRTVTGWHRWFNASGDSRGLARAITGASNAAFLFLIVSGAYLWLPRVWKWPAFRTRIFFNPKVASSKARDFNWHHVLGIWSALPLIVVVATAIVFSYGWANDLVYRSFGESPPRPGSSWRPAGSLPVAEPVSLDELMERGARVSPSWRRLTLELPEPDTRHATLTIDLGNGGQPQLRSTAVLDRGSGDVIAHRPFAGESPGRQARLLIRFLHTGEALGIAGQTVAGIVSLTSVLMVWTGLALAYRRLIAPWVHRHRRAGRPE
jgi:uncharacterized iron-regulated membrane protein